ncbi:integrase arm-type DNA-binding domain-containing protein [Salinivibrio sharmensis]|uniref:integrase arm-type DNA-binding domain-containing protein n=1 Tax=Salinivibrio sharmensis TaxID=390883 RepID=UPI0026AA854F
MRIKPNGSKLWLFDYYRPHTKKRTSLSFGVYPTVSLAEARTQRDEARKLLAQNIDPKENRAEQASAQAAKHRTTLCPCHERIVWLRWVNFKSTLVGQFYIGADISNITAKTSRS